MGSGLLTFFEFFWNLIESEGSRLKHLQEDDWRWGRGLNWTGKRGKEEREKEASWQKLGGEEHRWFLDVSSTQPHSHSWFSCLRTNFKTTLILPKITDSLTYACTQKHPLSPPQSPQTKQRLGTRPRLSLRVKHSWVYDTLLTPFNKPISYKFLLFNECQSLFDVDTNMLLFWKDRKGYSCRR